MFIVIIDEEETVLLPERQGLRLAHGHRARQKTLWLRRLRDQISQKGIGLVSKNGSLAVDKGLKRIFFLHSGAATCSEDFVKRFLRVGLL